MSNFIYTWYEPRFHAIKIGSTENSTSSLRMQNYAKQYGFKTSDLREFPVPSLVNLQAIELRCQQEVLAGRVLVPPTKELIALGHDTHYITAVGQVIETMARMFDGIWRELIQRRREARQSNLIAVADDIAHAYQDMCQ